jgi:hypothetical protein|nr:MAG TPA: hypothetical protein [Caudoviricetes sp.]
MAREYFCAYHSYRAWMEMLSDAEKGRLFDALLLYSETGEQLSLSGKEAALFPAMKWNIDRDSKSYDETCKKNRDNIKRRYERIQSNTTVYESYQGKGEGEIKGELKEKVLSNESTKKNAAASTAGEKEKYGEYGWVRLTPEEYSRMANEFGADTVKKYIQVVDELAQQTGNKNKWKDWNLTVRKAIRNQWGGKPREQTKGNSKNQRAPSYDLELLEQSLMEETL